MNDFFVNTLPLKTKELISLLQDKNPDWLHDFYLTGGTALSLFLGHRESEDLDWFTENNFDPIKLQAKIEVFGKLEGTEISEGTLNTSLTGIKLQFLEYPYPLLEPIIDWQNINLSSLIDIACTKLQTIGMRGSKKDFIDIYFLLKHFSFEELFKKLDKKYSKTNYNLPHILKSLVYFDNAENQPMPRMHQDVSWGKIKEEIIKKIKSFKF